MGTELNTKVFEPKDCCSICDSEYNDDEGGIQGYFGMMPVTFCVWCFTSMVDMVHQMDEDFVE